jgi:hypothetical protein
MIWRRLKATGKPLRACEVHRISEPKQHLNPAARKNQWSDLTAGFFNLSKGVFHAVDLPLGVK